MTEHVVEMQNVSFAYQAVPILDDVNLIVDQGEFVTIVGPNGGGKTTLLKLLLGLLRPDAGDIHILGDKPEKSRFRIGYMPQHVFLDTKFPVTVMEVVLLGRLGNRLGGRYSKDDRKMAARALEEVRLSHLADTLFSEISGGQRQRALIARALCVDPALLLLDEPTSNIDPEVEKNLLEILQELNQRMTILMVSHDIGFVSQVVERVVCVNRRVVIHPTSEINGTLIKDIYGGDYCMIRHDHRCSEEGHFHD
jgi:zinc transport system ATP-binding protein